MSKFTKVTFKVLDLLIIFMMIFGSPMSALAEPSPTGATVTTNLPDYPPGSTVLMTGAGWAAAESVNVVVTADDQSWTLNSSPADPIADSAGGFTYEFTLPDWFVPSYTVAATGFTSGTATVTFTDAQGSFSKPYAHWSDADLAWNNNILSAQKSDYFEGEVIPHVFMYGASNNAQLVNGQSYSFNLTYNYYQQNTNAGGFAYMTQYNVSRQPNVFNWATPAITPTADSAFTNGGGMAAGASFYTVDADITNVSAATYLGTGSLDGYVTITFTYTGVTTSNGYAAIYYGLFVANPGQVPNQGSGITKGASAWTGGSLQTTVDIGGSGATSIQLSPAAIIAGTISGLKWSDLNGNGIKDTGEPVLPNWTIQLCADSACNTVLQTTTTDANGNYTFSVIPGTYYVREVLQTGWRQTAPSSIFYGPITISALSPTSTGNNFGNQQLGTIIVNKTTVGGDATFAYTTTGGDGFPANFNITTSSGTGSQTYTNIVPGNYSVAESPLAGWTLTSSSCDTGTPGGFTLAAGGTVTCTFNNTKQAPALSITKVATESGYNKVGDVIHYTIVATNTGNTTLAAVTVTDVQVTDLTCTPANGSSLAPGASMTCTASHTIVQADLDAGSFYNQACVDDGTGGAAGVCADVTTPGTKTPHLAITKSADPTSYSKVGDVISYTIVATNDGNVTLHNVTVSDPSVSGLTCTPSNPVTDLAPGASINCTATHTVVQADLDAGHYANTACVDDGAGGADKACASKDIPGTQTPHLSISKVATETTYSKVGDVIHYTIVATNDGNVTLHNVIVSDPSVSGLTCTPANGSDLAPGASMNCTATHTITQADLDAGHYANTACVDDGTGGADKACASKDVPGEQTPHLSITKVATETTYSKVGDVIHYTIVATNDGNVTLHNVTVTDPSVSGLTCTPANGSDLAPGASMNCTATHTITQADLDAGHYANTACVDDGTGGADKACASKDVPGEQTPAIDLVKNGSWTDGNGNGFADVGETISYTFTVKNTGNVTLHNVTIADKVGGVTVSGGPIASLAPGASDSTTFTGIYTLTQVDINAGSFYNVATACGLSPIDVKVCDDGDKTVTFPPRLIVKKLVINDNGDTKKATDFSFKVNSGSLISFLQDSSDPLKGLNIVTVTGNYTVTEPAVYGYATTYSSDCTGTIAAGQTKTCTITNNDQPGTIIIKKITDPVNTGNFAFTTTGTGYNAFTLPGGGQNSQSLNAGTYTVKESTQLGWILTGIGQDPVDPNNPMACSITGNSGSTGTGDLTTQTATISLKNGDMVICVFENTALGVTRTQGFWATHPQLAEIAWFGGTAFGHTFPGVVNTAGISNTTLCSKNIDTLGKLMGGFWSDVSKTSTGGKRSSFDQARMQLLQQLLAAELNASAFGSVPAGGSGQFAVWEAAFCGTNAKAISDAQAKAASFNTKGDSTQFTPGTSADSKTARTIANKVFWDVLP